MRKLKYLSICLLSALALTACEDDPTVINPDPGRPSTAPDEISEGVGRLSIASDPANKYVFMQLHEKTSEPIYVELTHPASEDITFTISLDESFDVYSSSKELDAGFHNIKGYAGRDDWNEIISLDDNSVTIAKGTNKSTVTTLNIDGSGRFLNSLQIFKLIANGSNGTQIPLYICVVWQQSPQSDVSKKGYTVFSYVDTEVVNPMLANFYSFDFMSFSDLPSYENMPLIDVVNMRRAQLKYDSVSDHYDVRCTADQLHVLKHYSQMILPLQLSGKKVCLTIEGGGDGYGFANIPDGHIPDIANQIATLVNCYNLDGVNLRDEFVNYGVEGAPAINNTSYPRLIKKLRELLPDKMITLADDAGTVSTMDTAVDGISVGSLVDYVLNVRFNELNNPWDSLDRGPIAGLTKNRYAITAIDIRTDEDMMAVDELSMQLLDIVYGTDFNKAVVLGNLKYYDYGEESLFDNNFMFLTIPIYGWDDGFANPVYNSVSHSYYAFKKDW